MSPDPFEEEIRRVRPREIPPAWRQDILRAAHAAGDETRRARAPAFVKARDLWWQQLLWPYPKAWAGLAIIWVVLFVVNKASHPSRSMEPAEQSPIASAQMWKAFMEQRRILNQWIVSFPPQVSDKPKPGLSGTHGVIEKPFLHAV